MKKIPEGYKETELGVIPQEWEVKNLGELTELITKGTTPSTVGFDFVDEGINFIKVENISNNGVINIQTTPKISIECHEKLKRSKILEKDILVSIAGTIGRSAIVDEKHLPANTNQALAIVRLKNIHNVCLKYINYTYSSKYFYNYIQSIKTVGAQPNMSLKQLQEYKLFYPPLPEQQKIAEILSSVDEYIEKLDETISEYELLKKGMMKKLLTEGIGHTEFKDTEIGRIPKEWEVRKLGDCGEIITGNTPKSSESKYYGNDFCWVSPADLGDTKYILNTIKKLSNEGFQIVRQLKKGSVLVTCIGSTIGKIGILATDGSSNQQINSIICNEKLYNEFIYYSLKYNFYRFTSYISTQAVPIINKTVFSTFTLPIPPLPEQQEIASILSSIDERIDLYKAEKEDFVLVKKGLMEKLLTGKIRVTKPNLGV